MLPEILGHFVKVALTAAIGFSILHIAIADKKMRVDMIGIGVDGEQHFIALGICVPFRKIFRYLIRGYVVHIIIGMKRDRHLMRENSVAF